MERLARLPDPVAQDLALLAPWDEQRNEDFVPTYAPVLKLTAQADLDYFGVGFSGFNSRGEWELNLGVLAVWCGEIICGAKVRSVGANCEPEVVSSFTMVELIPPLSVIETFTKRVLGE